MHACTGCAARPFADTPDSIFAAPVDTLPAGGARGRGRGVLRWVGRGGDGVQNAGWYGVPRHLRDRGPDKQRRSVHRPARARACSQFNWRGPCGLPGDVMNQPSGAPARDAADPIPDPHACRRRPRACARAQAPARSGRVGTLPTRNGPKVGRRATATPCVHYRARARARRRKPWQATTTAAAMRAGGCHLHVCAQHRSETGPVAGASCPRPCGQNVPGEGHRALADPGAVHARCR